MAHDQQGVNPPARRADEELEQGITAAEDARDEAARLVQELDRAWALLAERDRELESFPSTADDTDRVLQLMTVTDALRALSQSHREILVETYFRGRTVPEAAELLDLPLGTAKSRVYYALRALRAALQQRGVTG